MTTIAPHPPILDATAGEVRPRIAMVSSALPPKLDGIGDYSSRLAAAFSKWADVTLHTARGCSPDGIPGVPVVQSFDTRPRREVSGLVTAIDRHPPDAIILQYNPFCFGQKGFNPHLAKVFRLIKQKHPQLHLTVMVHERFMPGNSPRNVVMFAYQWAQFRAITSIANLTLFSTGPWFESYRRWHPARKAGHMPVGSNLPYVPADRDAIRRKLNFPSQAIVLGTFGGNHPSRLFGSLAAAGRRLKSRGHDVRVLSIGSAGPAVKQAMPDLPVIDLGKLSAEEVSENLQAIDIYCSPFFDGVSTRRGSFFAGIQNGLATVTSRGYNTDGDLLSHAGRAFIATEPGDEAGFVDAVAALAGDPGRRNTMARQAKICFDENYALPVLADRWHDLLITSLPARVKHS